MPNLIATIASGDSIDYGGITVSRFYRYAKKIGADLKIITQPIFGEVINATHNCSGNPSWWKLPLIQWFGTQTVYDRLAFIDVDVFVTDSAANIFDFDDSPGIHMARDMNNVREYPLWLEWAAQRYPEVTFAETPSGYFNAGVWTLDRETAQKMGQFMHGRDIHSRWEEQDWMNLMARHTGALKELSPAFNHPVPFQTRDLTGGCFWHLCGLSQQDKLPWLEKMIRAEINGTTSL